MHFLFIDYSIAKLRRILYNNAMQDDLRKWENNMCDICLEYKLNLATEYYQSTAPRPPTLPLSAVAIDPQYNRL